MSLFIIIIFIVMIIIHAWEFPKDFLYIMNTNYGKSTRAILGQIALFRIIRLRFAIVWLPTLILKNMYFRRDSRLSLFLHNSYRQEFAWGLISICFIFTYIIGLEFDYEEYQNRLSISVTSLINICISQVIIVLMMTLMRIFII